MLRAALVGAATALAVLALPGVASAHEQPDGDGYVLADWMLLSWLVFFMAALIAFVIALKRGFFNNLEGIKYYLLTIDEPDYYTPDWAREEVRDEHPGGPTGLSAGGGRAGAGTGEPGAGSPGAGIG